MKIDGQMADAAVLREIGVRLRRARLSRNLSQAELAAQSGLTTVTVSNIERGKSAQLTSLIRLMRAMGLLGSLEAALPRAVPGPIELADRKGRKRERAAGTRGENQAENEAEWRWGDEK